MPASLSSRRRSVAEFLRDAPTVYVVGGALLTGLYWSLVFAQRQKGGRNGR
jgi:hypothetical protein